MDQQIGFFDLDGRKIAYSLIGNGPAIVFPSWWISHLEVEWRDPAFRRFFGELARTRTVVRYDRIGVGLSDRRRKAEDMSLSFELAALETLIDRVELERCALVGISCGGCIGAAYAARHPDRVERLLIYGGYAEGPRLAPDQVKAALVDLVRSDWGFGSRVLVEVFMTGAGAEERRAYLHLQRAAAEANLAADLLQLMFAFDAREEFANVQAPTIVLHRTQDRTIPFDQGREVAAIVPNARLVPLPGQAHHPWRGDSSGTCEAIAAALGTAAPPASSEPVSQLTPREREVLSLVARGFTDAEIAQQLVLSPHTVHRHLANIRGKLNLPSRTAAAAFAARLGIDTEPAPPSRRFADGLARLPWARDSDPS